MFLPRFRPLEKNRTLSNALDAPGIRQARVPVLPRSALKNSKESIIQAFFADMVEAPETMSYPEPPRSGKSAVKRAGRAISEGNASEKDYAIVDQWRASHAYVINTFQAWLKGHIKKSKIDIEFAQRLKRKNTVIGKLRRKNSDGRPLISSITSMHDLAGCRMIFRNLKEMNKFREYLHSSVVMRDVNHILRHDPGKYDYVERPKFSGYRGIHDVYKHYPRGKSHGQIEHPWNGLLVEIQYRTRVQHAWATAVEIFDSFNGEQVKFEADQSDTGRFFALASEIIARSHEDMSRAFTERSLESLRRELMNLERDMKILELFNNIKQVMQIKQVISKLRTHNVLNIYKNNHGGNVLEAYAFETARAAIQKATELENNANSLDAVYVRSDSASQIRSAYRNYFYDSLHFVELLADGDSEK